MSDYIIYPKQFRFAKIHIEKNRCFILMPFKKEFDYVYGVIKKELNDNGFICNRADEISGSKPILNKILTEILRSQYIIADLSGYNPNVFYELGVAHVFKDANNILIIKQKESQVPFDLSHLTYIEYTRDNLMLLTSTISKFISDYKYLAEFHEILNLRGVINIVQANREDFIDYIYENFEKNINILIEVLSYNHKNISEHDVIVLFEEYQSLLAKAIIDRLFDLLPGLLKVYYELIVACTSYSISECFIKSFLGDYLHQFELTEADILSWKTDLAIALATRKRKLNTVMPWLINYFSRSKSSTIDLNRYKIESFFMTTTDQDINKVISNAVFDDDCHIREHLADIIGEKKLYEAAQNISKQLQKEKNYFTATSFIAALGKLDSPEGIEQINIWIIENINDIIETKQFFVLKHARIAISALDKTVSKDFLNSFDISYGEYIKNYFIL